MQDLEIFFQIGDRKNMHSYEKFCKAQKMMACPQWTHNGPHSYLCAELTPDSLSKERNGKRAKQNYINLHKTPQNTVELHYAFFRLEVSHAI